MYTNILLFIIFNIIYVCVSQFFLFSLEWFPQQIIQRYCFFNLNSGVHRNFSVGRRGGGLHLFFSTGGLSIFWGLKTPSARMVRWWDLPSLPRYFGCYCFVAVHVTRILIGSETSIPELKQRKTSFLFCFYF